MSLSEILTLRSKWEMIINDKRRKYVLPYSHGTIDNLHHFVKQAHRKNRFRKGFDEALHYAESILNNKDNVL